MTASAISIPSSIEEITPEWLTAALREGGVITDAVVAGMKSTMIGVGVGILGSLARIELTYDIQEEGSPGTLVAKLPTLDPGGRGIGVGLGFYSKEIRFYQEARSEAAVQSPQLYYAAMDEAAGQFCALMEDLGGLRIGDQVAGCGIEDARTVVRAMARLHGAWWKNPRLDEFDWLPAMNAPVQGFVIMAYAAAIAPFIEKFGSRLTEAQRQLALDLGPRIAAIQAEWGPRRDTFLHGDARLDNIFFGSTDGTSPITLIDWQISLAGPGPFDVAYFLSQSLDPAERLANEERLLREYHAALAAAGAADYSWEQCWEDYRAAVLFCIVYPVIAGGTVDLANDRGVALANAMTDRSFAANTDLGTAELLARYAAS